MASTILEQVLENIGRGAVIPLRHRREATPERPPSLDPVAQSILAELDADLDDMVRRAVRLPALRRLPLRHREVREQIARRFADVAREEIAHAAFDLGCPVNVDAAPRPEPAGATIEQLQEVLGPLENLPGLIEERVAASRDQEILNQLRSLARDVHELSLTREAGVVAGSSGEAAPAPEPPKVPLHDIQKMIEFLK